MYDIYYAAMQDKEQLDGLLRVARDINAKKILEIGTMAGGTAAALASQGAEVTTMDITDYSPYPWEKEEYKKAFPNAKVRFIKADSRTFVGAQNVRLPNNEKYDLVFIDGEHTDLSGYMDWKQYAEMGKVIAQHDIALYDKRFEDDWLPRNLWKMIKDDGSFTTEEFNKLDYAGIGVIYLKDGDYQKITKMIEAYLFKKLK
ncbi:MAG: class I SAM-dependent methyltransferase [Sulfurovaceae bacterium]|nr:class I SAM-dependent methyltransferase [Sulfurovaceae bacterium]